MESADLGQHTSRRFNEDMERVRTRVMQMGGFVEQQLQRAVTALVEGDSRLGEEVARDDYRVNQMEVEIDEECGRIIATRQPAASDLRVMVAIIKTITDLERIGDEVEKVGYIAARLATMEKPADNYREIRHLGKLVTEMVHDALHAFARLEADEAFEVARRDRKVDEEYEAIQRQSITFMMEDPRIDPARAGDHVGRASTRTDRRSRQEYLRVHRVHGPRQGHPSPVTRRRRAPDPRHCGREERRLMVSRRAGNWLGAAACAAAIAFAFYSQYGLGLVPCHLCIFQRVTVAALGIVFVLAAFTSRPGMRGILFAVLVGLAGFATIATAGRHVWIQMQPEGSVPACGADLAFMLDLFPLTEVILKVFKAGGECAKIDWSFLGLSMPAWVLVLALVLTAGGIWINLRKAA